MFRSHNLDDGGAPTQDEHVEIDNAEFFCTDGLLPNNAESTEFYSKVEHYPQDAGFTWTQWASEAPVMTRSTPSVLPSQSFHKPSSELPQLSSFSRSQQTSNSPPRKQSITSSPSSEEPESLSMQEFRMAMSTSSEPTFTWNQDLLPDQDEAGEATFLSKGQSHMCPINDCNKIYRRKGDLKFHVLHKHAEHADLPTEISKHKSEKFGKDFPCPLSWCKCGFRWERDLRRHWRSKHADLGKAILYPRLRSNSLPDAINPQYQLNSIDEGPPKEWKWLNVSNEEAHGRPYNQERF